MTKPEPLKGKRFVAVLRNSNWEGYSVEDVKSAVEWLLLEIDKSYGCVHHPYGDDDCILCVTIGQTLNHVKRLIKTAFEDVMERGDDK